MNLFSKLNSNEYNNRLEQILENKKFDGEVKNLLLSMLYKIENGYKDYTKVKEKSYSKEEFMEQILYIVKEECAEIKIVTPKTEQSKPLEEENANCKIDVSRGSILVYANEQDLLYSLIKMNILQKRYEKDDETQYFTYYEKAIKEFMQIGKNINDIEIIRDFDGWSWNNNLKTPQEIETNLIFQNIIMSHKNINDEKFYDDYIQAVNQPYEYEKNLYTMILTLSAEQNKEIKKIIYKELENRDSKLKLMNDRKKFLNQITQEKKQIANDIKNIDGLLNDKEKLREEYTQRNAKLENKDKIFSISHLAERLEKERKQKLEELKLKNRELEPLVYVKQKEELENECNLLKRVVDNLENKDKKMETIIEIQKEFLQAFAKQVEDIKDKECLERVIYQFRYYCLLPIEPNKCVYDVEELKQAINKAMNVIIDNCIDKEIITNFSNSISLCYNILKYVFITKIIDLKEISIKITKEKEEQLENGKRYYITISIYDAKDAESSYNEVVDNLKLLNVKTNKKIPLFL
ncbi:MAG: hypothetical protein ACI4VQ_01080 [Clostridia bacterium]